MAQLVNSKKLESDDGGGGWKDADSHQVAISMQYIPKSAPTPSYTAAGISNSAYVQDEMATDDSIITISKTSPQAVDGAVDVNGYTGGKSKFAVIYHFFEVHRAKIKRTLLLCIFILYNVYWGFAIHHTWSATTSWCHGVKFLTIWTVVAYVLAVYYLFLQKINVTCVSFVSRRASKYIKCVSESKYTKWIFLGTIFVAIVVYLIVDSANNRERLISGAGLLTLLVLGFIFSKHRRKVVWRQVILGVFLQFAFGLCILRWSVGKDIFECLGNKVETFLGFTDYGSTFVFGYLTSGLPGQASIFAFKVIPVILFFSFCVSILYYYGIMQVFVLKLGWFLQKVIGTTGCESVSAAANIFLGMTEAPLMIRPYISNMTRSELHAVMTGGYASIAGSVLAAYINFGVDASHLISASVMSAPAALAFSKLVYPETEVSRTTAENIAVETGTEKNALQAGANGVSTAISLCANICANLIAFLAFIHFLDFLTSWLGSLVGYEYITFEWLLSKALIPLAFMMGVSWKDTELVARLIGLKTVVNEFVAYAELGKMTKENLLSRRSQYISTYALCGFSNIGSIGIQIGGIGSLAPERRADISQLAVRAMITGSAACFMTACIAGMLLDVPGTDENVSINNVTSYETTTFPNVTSTEAITFTNATS